VPACLRACVDGPGVLTYDLSGVLVSGSRVRNPPCECPQELPPPPWCGCRSSTRFPPRVLTVRVKRVNDGGVRRNGLFRSLSSGGGRRRRRGGRTRLRSLSPVGRPPRLAARTGSWTGVTAGCTPLTTANGGGGRGRPLRRGARTPGVWGPGGDPGSRPDGSREGLGDRCVRPIDRVRYGNLRFSVMMTTQFARLAASEPAVFPQFPPQGGRPTTRRRRLRSTLASAGPSCRSRVRSGSTRPAARSIRWYCWGGTYGSARPPPPPHPATEPR
jgi:hypothetical protein